MDKKRDKEFEKTIQNKIFVLGRDNFMESLLFYCMDVIKGRFPKAEKIILNDSQFSYYYCRFVLKSRWLKAEAIIANDKYYIFAYTRDLIKSRWIELEKIINYKSQQFKNLVDFNYFKSYVQYSLNFNHE